MVLVFKVSSCDLIIIKRGYRLLRYPLLYQPQIRPNYKAYLDLVLGWGWN